MYFKTCMRQLLQLHRPIRAIWPRRFTQESSGHVEQMSQGSGWLAPWTNWLIDGSGSKEFALLRSVLDLVKTKSSAGIIPSVSTEKLRQGAARHPNVFCLLADLKPQCQAVGGAQLAATFCACPPSDRGLLEGFRVASHSLISNPPEQHPL